MKLLTTIKRAVFNARFHRVNRHYATDPVVGQRTKIEREGKEAVEVLFYYPEKNEKAPVFVQIHGGAWVGMDAVDDDRYCQRLSEDLGAFVVNVNYRRLYDKSFPYPQEEVVDTVKWLKENAEELGIDENKIVISGGSAGGHLTAGAAIMLAKQGIKIAGQIMEVPFLDFTGSIPIDFPEGNGLYDMMFELYPPQIPLDSEVLSPAAAISEETLEKLSPAVVIVCGRDPLHPQGEHYAKLLKEHGKLIELKKYEEGYHGFGTDKAEEMPLQNRLREDCYKYKVEKAGELFEMAYQRN
ncbi:MAG: alpha/beta hydrolase [Solobacterium sp.]|nr:alpha/beta hydrolase [Solobacterium sp.]